MFMWTPCFWQGIQGIQDIENPCLWGPPVSGRVYMYTGYKKLMFMWTPCIWQGVGYTGYGKLMFMWTPCIWQGVQGIQVKENSCLCGPPVSGRVQGIQEKENFFYCLHCQLYHGSGIDSYYSFIFTCSLKDLTYIPLILLDLQRCQCPNSNFSLQTLSDQV